MAGPSAGDAAGGIALLLMMAIPWIIGITAWVFTIVALVDAIKVPNDSDYRAGTKLIWVLVILFGNCVGAIIYYAVGRPQARV
jgi:predicted RNase H-related nuclease YkuK (DUF458 family)